MSRPGAVVTGAARGIGLAVAQHLSATGHEVVGLDRDGDALRQGAACWTGSRHVVGSASDGDALAAACDLAAAAPGGLRVFVANAGFSRPGVTDTYPREDWDALLDVHLTGAFEGSRIASRHMGDGGAIVLVSSISAAQGFAGRAAYCAAKAGVSGLARALAVEWAPRVRVNAVAPGYVETDIVTVNVAKGVIDPQTLLSRTPMRRLGRPADIAAAVGFLASDAASWITGEVLSVDGGWSVYGLDL